MKLNLGCGSDIRQGYVNVDRAALPGVDVVHDLTVLPLPFDDGVADEALCLSILEHLDCAPFLRDVHRILKPGGRAVIEVPHFTSADMYRDPTHCNFFSTYTFTFFAQDTPRSYYFDFAFAAIETLHLKFAHRRLFFYNRLIEWLVNRSPWWMELYETSPLRVFPAWTVFVVLRK